MKIRTLVIISIGVVALAFVAFNIPSSVQRINPGESVPPVWPSVSASTPNIITVPHNIAIGYQAMKSIITGTNNVYIGCSTKEERPDLKAYGNPCASFLPHPSSVYIGPENQRPTMEENSVVITGPIPRGAVGSGARACNGGTAIGTDANAGCKNP